MKKIFYLFVTVGLLCWGVDAGAYRFVDMVPKPAAVENSGLSVEFGERLAVFAGDEKLESLAQSWMSATGNVRLPEIRLSSRKRSADILLSVDEALEREEYRLSITSDGRCQIRGGSAAGVWWGLQSLSQLMIKAANSQPGYERLEMPVVSVKDKPSYAYRTVMLDCKGRSFSADELRRIVDMMVLHKLNVLGLNLADGLAEKAVMEYAAERYVKVVPEKDNAESGDTEPGDMKPEIAHFNLDCTQKPVRCDELFEQFDKSADVKGVQVNVKAGTAASFDKIEYMLLPYLAAFGERAWSEEKDDYISFVDRLRYALVPVYKHFGYTYASDIFKPSTYDEGRIRDYKLPEILETSDRRQVKTVRVWENKRRPEILSAFQNEMFGVLPSADVELIPNCVEQCATVFGGKATRKQVELTMRRNGVERKTLILIYIPNNTGTKVPCFIGLNFQGNHATSLDTDIICSPYSDHPVGNKASRWPVEKVIDAGYALVTANYYDFFYDKADGDFEGKYPNSIMPLFGKTSSSDFADNEGRAISAWAWGYSRILDYITACEDRIAADKVAVMGHSRLGKAALWAGANDPRFAVVISNNSGCCGAALSRRRIGEDLHNILRFKHWFCKGLDKYYDNDEALPMDQHMLLAMIAPRPLYVASAEDDKWADPKGEFQSAVEASKAYGLYGLKALEDHTKMPALNSPLNDSYVGYHIRTGIHDVTDYDWECFITFCDRWLK